MQFEKAIRRRQLPAEPLGHVEPESPLNSGDPLMDTSKRRGNSCLDAIDQLPWPQEILLELSWRAIRINTVGPMVQSIVPDFSYSPVQLYAPESLDTPNVLQQACLGIEIIFQKVISQLPDELTVLAQAGECVSSIDFATQGEGSVLVLRRKPLATGDWFITPPKKPELANINVLGLFAYSGWAQSGNGVQAIEQLFAQITHMGDATQVNLKRYTELLNRKVAPPRGGQMGRANVVYVDSFGVSQDWSLMQAITSGKVQVSLCCDGQTREYHSVRVVDENASTDCFTLLLT